MNEQTTALITADNEKIKYALTHPDALAILLDEVKTHVEAFKGSTATATSRKQIASFAYKIAQTKTAVDSVGKNEIATIKTEVKKYDNARKTARETLDGYRDQVREPLTKWEAEQAKAKTAIDSMVEVSAKIYDDIKEVDAIIGRLELVDVSKYPEDMQARAEKIRFESLELMKDAKETLEKAQAEREELERLRIAEARRVETDRLAKVEAEQKEEARIEAEAKVNREIEDANRRAEQAEADKRDAEERERQSVANAKAEAKRREEMKEQQRIQLEADQRRADDKRIQDATHRATVQGESFHALVATITTIGRNDAIAIIRAITDGKINHVTINF